MTSSTALRGGPIRRLHLDIEGTLFDGFETPTEPGRGHFGCYIQAVRELTGQTITFEEIVARNGQAIGGGELVVSATVADICHHAVSAERLRTRKEELFEAFAASTPITFRPGVERFLTAMVEHGIPLSTASVTMRGKGERYLDALGLERFVPRAEWIFLEDVQTAERPRPTKRDVHYHLMDRHGIAPENILLIGDSVSDAVEAKAAGCHFAIFPVFRTPFVLQKLVDAGATRIFGGFEEVDPAGLIRSIESGVV